MLCVSSIQEEELDSLRESIEAVDQNRPPLKVINGYSVLDHLGTGAFGSVFKVSTNILKTDRNCNKQLWPLSTLLLHGLNREHFDWLKQVSFIDRSESRAARTSWL